MRPTILHVGGVLYWTIQTRDPDTLLLKDADATPSVSVRKNGASVADSVTITKRSATTGLYDCSYNPAAEVEGDTFQFEERAQVTGTTTAQQYYDNQFNVRAVHAGAVELDSASRATLVDEIWDEVLTGGTHNVQNSAGKRLRQVISSVIHTGTAQGPGTSSNQIVLDIGASSVNGAYDPAGVYISGGTGSGQSRLILDYVGSTKTATVDRSWKVNPDATSEFVVYGNPGREHVNEGLAVAGTSNSITLNSSASAYDNIYVGQSVFIRSGTGEDQIGVITTYNGTTKVATIVTGAVGGQWETIPDTTSAYVMLPSGPSLLSAASISAVQTGISTLTAAQVNAEVLDVLSTDTFGELAAPPAATSSLKDKLTWLFMWIRNKGTATATQRKLYADDGTTLVSTETITDDGTTFTKGEAS